MSQEVYDVDMDSEPYQFADIVTFKAPSPLVSSQQMQGRLVSVYATDPHLDSKMAVVQLLYRPTSPKDLVTKREVIREYWESQDILEVPYENLLMAVPWVVAQTPLVFSDVKDLISSQKELQIGVIAISAYLGHTGRLLPPVDGKHVVEWYQFDPQRRDSPYPMDITNQFWEVVKTVLFDPLVSPLSRAGRGRRSKNRNVWEIMVCTLDESSSFPSLKERFQKGTVSLLDSEKMLFPEEFLPRIHEHMKSVCQLKEDGILSVAEVMQQLLRWADVLEQQCDRKGEQSAKDVWEESDEEVEDDDDSMGSFIESDDEEDEEEED